MHERVSARKLQTSIRWCTVQLYVACVTPILGVDAWTGTAMFSVARLVHFAEKLEQLGLIGDVSSYHNFATRRLKVYLNVAGYTLPSTNMDVEFL